MGLSEPSAVCQRLRGSVRDVRGLSEGSAVCQNGRQSVRVVCGSRRWCVEGLADPQIDAFYDSFRPF